MHNNVEHIKVRLHALSPVHIGCDDVYEPTRFVIDPERNKLVDFDPFDFVQTLDAKERVEFMEIVNKGTLASIIELYRFISNKRSKIKGREIDIAEGLVTRYRDVKSLQVSDNKKIKQELNNFIISRTSYNPQNNLPFIPGSSLKGALRTGYLSMLACSGGDIEKLKEFLLLKDPASPITGRKNARKLEEELLGGNFSKDPFRMVKVSDLLPARNVKTKIIYAVNRKKESGMPGRGPYQIFETIQTGAIFEGSINIETPLSYSAISKPIDTTLFYRAVHKHYARVYNEEFAHAKKMNFPMPNTGRFKEAFKKKAFLIRIGRHSGAEAITIEGNRHIKIMQGKGNPPKHEKHSTTIWLSSNKANPENNKNLFPFGWAVIEFVN